MANKPTKEQYEGFKKAVNNPMTPAPLKASLQSIIDKYSSEYEGTGAGGGSGEAKTKATTTRKPASTAKKPTTAKPKKTATDIEKAKAEIKAKTGKTEAECESIIEQYRALRTKAQEGKRKAEQASADNKKRVEKLDNKGDIIKGTNEKTADAVIESTAKDVAEKIEKQVEAVEEKAEKEAKAEVAKDKTIKTPKAKKEAVEAKVEEKVKKETKTIVKRVVIDTSALLTSIATSLGKFDKDSQKEFLIKLRSDIDKLLSKYSAGGLTDGGVQVMNVQQSNMSSSSVNPSHFANGGGVGKLKVGKDDFSFLLKLSDNDLSKRLDLIRKEQVINGKQYLDAKKRGDNTSKIEESGKNLSNQENAIIQARIRVNKFANGGVIIAGVPHKIEMDRDISELKLLGAKRIELSHPRGDVYALDNKGYVNIGYDFYSFDLKDLPKIKKAYYSGKYATGGVVGQEIVFDDNGEENTGVIKEIHETTGDYIVNTDDGRTILAQLDRDVISLGGMRKKATMDAPRKRFGFFEGGGGVSDVDYSDILAVLEDKLTEAVANDIPNDFENSYNATGEEVESKSRDGFIPYTDGGYEVRWFEYLSQFYSGGYSLPTKALDKEKDRQIDYNLELARESFMEDYPEIVEELGEDNIDYNSLYEAGYEDEAEQLSNAEMDNFDGTIMCEIGAYYYTPNNDRGIEGENTLRLFGLVNLESPYHRSGNLEDRYDIDITFNSIEELEEKVDAGLKEITEWFNGSNYNEPSEELRIRRMATGGKLWIDTKTKGGTKGVKPSRKNSFARQAQKRGITSGQLASRVLANPKRYQGINPKSAQLVKNMGVRKQGGSIGDILRNRRGK